MTFSDAGFVFLPCGVEDVVTTVFDGPVFPVEFENALCIGVLGAEVCDAVDEFFGAFSGLDGGAGSVDAESLPDMGELDFVPDVVIEFCRGPDCAALFSSVIGFGVGFAPVGGLAISEEEFDGVPECGLVALGDHHVVSVMVVEEACELSLCEQGIDGDCGARQGILEGFEQGDDDADFVGSLDVIAVIVLQNCFF